MKFFKEFFRGPKRIPDIVQENVEQVVERKVKVYTAEDVRAEVTAMALILVEGIKKNLEEIALPNRAQIELEILRKVGMTNSKTYKDLVELSSRVNKTNDAIRLSEESSRLMNLIRCHYGRKCMLIRKEDFARLLDRYNLSCGLLSDYHGVVPYKQLLTIEAVKDFLEEYFSEDYDARQEINWICEQIQKCYRIKKIRSETGIDPKDYERCPLVERNRVFSGDFPKDSFSFEDASKILIAAPAQEMDTLFELENRVRTEDPIVFSIAKQGVIVWTAWAEDGKDEVAQRYRQVNEMISSAGATLGLNTLEAINKEEIK